MKQGEVTIFPATVRIPCDIWGCRSGQMASHFLGRPENPKNVLTNLCPTCLEQLTGNVKEQFGEGQSDPVLQNEIDKLAEFILANYPDEIGAGDPVNGESAVDVAIRLLQNKAVETPEDLGIVIIDGDASLNNSIDNLEADVISAAGIPTEAQEPDTEDVLEIDGKLITDFTVRELKELAQEEKISGYSDKNKEELIELITTHFEKSEE